ncbi:MAG: energy transducer TonB [Candidatus Acidiferrales bacterium]
MRDPGLLADCLVENDSKDAAPAKLLRRESFVLSILIQGALVAALLIIPIFTPEVISSRYSFVPMPPYHGGTHLANTVHASPQTERRVRPVFNSVALYQPIRIPEHIANSQDANASTASNDPPAIGIGDGSASGPGVDFGMGNSVLTPTVAPPRPSEPTKPVHVSAGVEEARLITRIEPVYPPGAIALHMSGTVLLRAIISTDGTVRRLDVVTGNPILARAAVAAVGQWRYHPTLLNGRAVEVETDITVIFELTH